MKVLKFILIFQNPINTYKKISIFSTFQMADYPFPMPLVRPNIISTEDLRSWCDEREPYAREFDGDDRVVYQRARASLRSRDSYHNRLKDPIKGAKFRLDHQASVRAHRAKPGTPAHERIKQNDRVRKQVEREGMLKIIYTCTSSMNSIFIFNSEELLI